MTQARRILVWLMLLVLAALLAYFGVRGYLSADFLLNFSNAFVC